MNSTIELLKERIQIESLCQQQIERLVQRVNQLINQEIVHPTLSSILTNLRNTIQYRFIQQKRGASPSLSYSLVDSYFTRFSENIRGGRVDSYSSLIQSSSSYYCANNGWTFDNCRDPLCLSVLPHYLFRNGIKEASFCIHTKYLLREMVIWSDCVKLRYYSQEGQYTSIWGIIKEYVQLSAFLFDGFRLDNCHNTSLDLLQDVLHEGRCVNPHLIVLAELFTSNQDVDIDYISRLGLDMIVREIAHDPSYYQNVKNVSDILYHAGGRELGDLSSITEVPRQIIQPFLPTALYDITHDNRSFYQLYGIPAIPAVTVMLAMTVTQTATTKGMDEGYPDNPQVTTIKPYSVINNTDNIEYIRQSLLSGESSPVVMKGNMYVRLLMNHLHQLLSKNQFNERYVHHYTNTPLVSIERRIASSFYSVLSITHTAFKPHDPVDSVITILGRVVGIFVAVRCCDDCYHPSLPSHSETLTGIDFHLQVSTESIPDFCHLQWNDSSQETSLHFSSSFTPGASLVLLIYNGDRESFTHFLNYQECCSIIQHTHERLLSYPNHPYEVCQELSHFLHNHPLSLSDWSYLVFTSSEEQYAWNHWHCYSLPSSSSIVSSLDNLTHSHHQHHNHYGTGELTYAGFYGVIPVVRQIVRYNILNHPLLDNIREGNWLMDYLIDRLNTHPSLSSIQQTITKEFSFIKSCPKNTRPVKFCRFMILLGDLFEKVFCESVHIERGSPSLVLAILQFTNQLPQEPYPTLPAGFPHFATGIMRNWGRDTFIAAPGILLQTQHYEEMRYLLLDYGSLARNGLICNLRGDRKCPRYNSRDATWWWLHVRAEESLLL